MRSIRNIFIIFTVVATVLLVAVYLIESKTISYTSEPLGSNISNTMSNIGNDPQIKKISDLRRVSDELFADRLGIKDKKQYDTLLYYMNDFLDIVGRGDISNAYLRVSPNFLKHKGIGETHVFERYLKDRRFDKLSCNIISIAEHGPGTYKVGCVYIDSYYGNSGMDEEQFAEYLNERYKTVDEYVVIRKALNGYVLSFEGFINTTYPDLSEHKQSVYDMKLQSAEIYCDKIVMNFDVSNLSDKILRLKDIISTVGVSSGDSTNVVHPYKDTVDEVLFPGQQKILSIPVKYHGDIPDKAFIYNSFNEGKHTFNIR